MINQQDKEEFQNLVSANRKIIFKICHSYCSNKSDIEDLAQEIIYQLWKSYPNYNTGHKFTTWMYRVSLNVAISFYRKEKIKGRTVSLEYQVPEIEDQHDSDGGTEKNISLLRKFILELKELDRALMILYLEEKSYSEIADILGISETNVATKINRIKKILKEKFETTNTL